MDFDSKQTVGQLLLSMGALGIVLAPASIGFAAEVLLAADQQSAVVMTMTGDSALNVKQEPPAPGQFARYDSEQFSVGYPSGWQVEPQGNNGVVIVSMTDGVNMPIRTDIVVLREDPQTAVPQKLDQIAAEAVDVQRYSLVAVDGQSGIRLWYEPETGQQGLITFVGYGNEQTVVLSSQYAQDVDVEDLITQIHTSFVNHSIAQASTP